MDGLDFIGDIHGHFDPLKRLLEKLEYRMDSGVYRHPSRKAIFLGDLVDRGPENRQVVNTVRAMVEAGTAVCLMGNHEFNCLAYHYLDDDNPGEYLRRRTPSNNRQVDAFKTEYPDDAEDLPSLLEWFHTLPLAFEAEGVRAVHAAWSQSHVDTVRELTGGAMCLSVEHLVAASRANSDEFIAVEMLCKGPEVELPDGLSFSAKGDKKRTGARVRWWASGSDTVLLRDQVIGPRTLTNAIAGRPAIPHEFEYGSSERPVFFGHYWFEGTPAPASANAACLDFSVAKPGGYLCAYRFDGEPTLSIKNFLSVPGSAKRI